MKDYMGHFYPIWIKHSGVMLGRGKNRLKQFCDSVTMKIDRILCLNDSELYWTGSFTGKILTRQKWLLTQSWLEV